MGCLKVSKVDATKKLQWPDVRLVHEEAQIIARFVHITAVLTTNVYVYSVGLHMSVKTVHFFLRQIMSITISHNDID